MKRFARIAAIAGKGVLVALLALLLAYDGYILIARACGVRAPTVFGFATAAVAIVLLVYLLGFKKHDPARLWVNQMWAHPRLAALVYPEGEGDAWLEKEKKRLERDFTRTEAYALPRDIAPEDRRELIDALRARPDLSQVLVMGEKTK